MAEKYHKQLYSHHGYTTTMTTDPTKASKTGAENIEWDLTDLYTGIDEAGLGGDLASIEKRAQTFREKWNGKLDVISIPEFVTMVEEYENLVETFDRMGSYTNLLWSTDSENTEYGRLLQTVRETLSRAMSHLIFVSTQLSHLSETRFGELLAAPDLSSRSEDVERALSAKSITARASWVRLHDEVANSQVFKFNGQELTLAAISKLSYEKDRETRKAATEALSAGLAEEAKTHAFVFNTIIADCETNQRLRGYPSWISSRNLENEVSDESVQTLINAVVDRYDLVRRYYGVKQQRGRGKQREIL
jgi:oligoendopeptidase F